MRLKILSRDSARIEFVAGSAVERQMSIEESRETFSYCRKMLSLSTRLAPFPTPDLSLPPVDSERLCSRELRNSAQTLASFLAPRQHPRSTMPEPAGRGPLLLVNGPTLQARTFLVEVSCHARGINASGHFTLSPGPPCLFSNRTDTSPSASPPLVSEFVSTMSQESASHWPELPRNPYLAACDSHARTDKTAVEWLNDSHRAGDSGTGGLGGVTAQLHRLGLQDTQQSAAIVKLSRTLAMFAAFHFVLALLQALWGK